MRAEDFGSPLTGQQRSVWAAQELALHRSAYNVAAAHRLRGPLDPDRLDTVLRRVLRAQPVLRVSLDGPSADGLPRQVVRPVPTRVLAEADTAPDRLAGELTRLAEVPFAAADPLRLRAHLLRVAPDDHVLLLVLDHVAVDGPSVAVLLRALAAAWHDPDADLIPPGADYFDYARAQAEFAASEEGAGHTDFWRELAAAAPSATPGRAMPATSARTGSVPVRLPDDLSAACARVGATPFVVCTAALTLVVQHYLRVGPVRVAFPAVDWRRAHYPDVVGPFSDMLELCAPDPAAHDLPDYLGTVHERLLDSLAHQGVPLDPLWAAANRAATGREGASGQPLVVSYDEDSAVDALTLAGLDVERVVVPSDISKADLLLSVTVVGTTVVGRLDHRLDCYDEAAAVALARAFETVMDQLLAGAEVPAAAVALDETAVSLTGAPAVSAPGIIESFTAAARRAPDAIALVADGQETTYAELDAWSRGVAARLRALELPAGSVVGLCLPRSAGFVAAVLGVLRAGHVFLPVDVEHPPRRRAFVLTDAGARAAVTDGEPEGLPRGVLPVAVTGPAGEPAPDAPHDPAATAYLITTSGSTGMPKSVAVAHGSLVNHLRFKLDHFGLGAGDRFYFKTPPVFDASLWEYLAPLMAGASVVVAPPQAHRDPAHLLAEMRAHAVTVVQFVPTLLRAVLAESAEWDCPRLRRVFCGGERMDQAAVDAVCRAAAVSVVNLYGPTEATIDATFHECAPGGPPGPVPIGLPLPGTTATVVGRGGQVLPPGFPGELVVGGIAVAQGYRNRAELTRERFAPGPDGARSYRTGDIVVLRPDGLLDYRGREDGQTKVRGIRVELEEVRGLLLGHPAVADAVVVVHPQRPDVLVAYYVAPAEPDEVRAYLAERMAPELLPAHLVPIERVPTTATGKVDPGALPVPRAGRAMTASTRPRGKVEGTLTRLWARVLGVGEDRVPRDISLFDLGGSSVTLIRLHQAIREELSATVAVTDLFKHPTISALAERLTGAGAEAEDRR